MKESTCIILASIVYGMFCACGFLFAPLIGPVGILVYLSFITTVSYMGVFSRRVNLISLLLNILVCVYFLLFGNGFGTGFMSLFLLIPLLLSALFVCGSQMQREPGLHVALVILYSLLSALIILYVLWNGFKFSYGSLALWLILLVPTALFTLLLQIHKHTTCKESTLYAIGFLGVLVFAYIYCQMGIIQNLFYPLERAFPGSI